jgi:hypothetical protein
MNTNDDYWKFAESERHFNETQAGIRNHAATWMLAAFAAIAILLKSEDKVNWLVSPAVLVGVVSVMATIGLLVLWINDQLVYQRLLDCGFIIALKMEYDNPQLPPIRAMMTYSAEGKGMSRWMTYFYTIPMWGFLAISVAATLLRRSIGSTSQGVDTDQSFIVLITICIAQCCTTLWVQRKKSDVGAKTRAALFGNKDFAAMFEDTDDARARLAKVIASHRPAAATEGGTVK